MKLVLTGGHLSPALAVLEALPKGSDVLFIGRKYALEGDDAVSLEHRTAQRLGIPFTSITTGRIQRKFTKYTLFSLFKLPVGFWQSYKILKQYNPDVILTFGGYLSIPVACAAYFLKVPIVIHEQTLDAGAANKVIARIAKKICISWESSSKYFPANKIMLTGNPLRKEFLESKQLQSDLIDHEFENEKLPFLYITGGSLGSHPINSLIEETIKPLLHNYKIIHQTGDTKQFQDYERLLEIKNKLPKNLSRRYILTRFTIPSDVAAIMKKADLVISRSGINTITELIYLNKMSLLIPLPHGQNNEQKKNAQFLKSVGLGEVLNQDTTTPSHLLSVIEGMLKNKEKYTLKNPAAQMDLCKNAASAIVDIVRGVV